MKSFDSRTYSINDFVEWEAQGTLVLNPAFQRRAVWGEKAKSYLMDTIIRGKPIPKIFIRQKINPSTKSSIRDVVDGQQRLRTILSFIKDGFSISRRHNAEYGGRLFTQLEPETQTQILGFELSVDLLINLPDPEILDIFSRLNAYAVVLNDQEKINADHFGPFKVLADEIGRKYYEYWIRQGLIAERSILRMAEVTLVAELLIVLCEGIKSKKQLKRFYDDFEEEFPYETVDLARKFDSTITLVGALYLEGLTASAFHRLNLFYSLFCVCAHSLFGIKNFGDPRLTMASPREIQSARNRLDEIDALLEAKADGRVSPEQAQFLKDIRLATTDQAVRERRARFLTNLIAN
jgi:hypothetical protein